MIIASIVLVCIYVLIAFRFYDDCKNENPWMSKPRLFIETILWPISFVLRWLAILFWVE
jgi:hypothetical protein